MILHVIDGTEPDWATRYKAIRHEMDSYGGGLLTKPEIVVINKIDAISDETLAEKMTAFKKSFGRKKKPQILTISAAGRTGVEKLISEIEKLFLGVEDAGTK
jgi:GTP-binding protein